MAFHPKIPLPQPQNQHLGGSPAPSPPQLQVVMPLPVTLHLPPSLEEHHSHVLRLAVIVTACVVGVVMFLCTVSIILKRFYSRRHNHNQNRRDSPILFDVNGDSPISDDEEEAGIVHPIWFIRTVGLQQSFIDSITVFKYRKDEGLIDGTDCSVCLGEFQQDESLRLLPKCSHAFHIPCIDTWLRSHTNCPLCRAPVVHDGSGTTDHNHTDSNVSDHQEAQIEISDGGVGLGSHLVGERELTIEGDDGSGVSAPSGIPDKMLPKEVEEKIQSLRRSVSMDSSSASMIFRDVVVDLNSDRESSDTHFGEKVNSSSKDMTIANHVVGVQPFTSWLQLDVHSKRGRSR